MGTDTTRRTVLKSVPSAGILGFERRRLSSGSRSRRYEIRRDRRPVTYNQVSSSVLLIKDCRPWSSSANERALEELDEQPQILPSSDAGSNLPKYDVVIVPSAQPQSYYDNLTQVESELREFVSQGGTLITHLAGSTGNARPCSGELSSRLPAGVSPVGETDENVSMNSPSHPILSPNSEQGRDLSEFELQNWYWSTHGYFENVPDSATLLVGVSGEEQQKPTFIEYTHGFGRVLATMQPLEWPYSSDYTGDVSADIAKHVLRNEFRYALDTTAVGGPRLPSAYSVEFTPVAASPTDACFSVTVSGNSDVITGSELRGVGPLEMTVESDVSRTNDDGPASRSSVRIAKMVPIPKRENGNIELAISAGKIALTVVSAGTSNAVVQTMDTTATIAEEIMNLNQQNPETGVKTVEFGEREAFSPLSAFTGEARYMVHIEAPRRKVDLFRVSTSYQARPNDPGPTQQDVQSFGAGVLSMPVEDY